MIQILHNPRCRKSREGLAIVEASGQPFEVIKYLDEPLNKSQLKTIIDQLQIEPLALVRTNESIWKENYKGKDLSDEAIIDAMVKHPKLIERPIVIKNNKAVVGRPPEQIKTLL
ncbi:MAG: arsenate reductase (glutaredoxin) [Winogradskyella sp.]|nr:arsenate reductase (glutaredoxin) [Winogradskyella sp.]NNC44391.1 arsenate reductase (glutaredoxin) [Winogradskyella sp.]NNF86349.1 arsenate reductase (glutaredoxin) [Winogradskyella sp.]NNL82938.1 arsenate reductase (glutaredoxin) [Winogradskyella sp.]